MKQDDDVAPPLTFNGASCTIEHQPDLSGKVRIIPAPPEGHLQDADRVQERPAGIEVAGFDLLSFVAEYVRQEHIKRAEAEIEEIEQATIDEIFGIGDTDDDPDNR